MLRWSAILTRNTGTEGGSVPGGGGGGGPLLALLRSAWRAAAELVDGKSVASPEEEAAIVGYMGDVGWHGVLYRVGCTPGLPGEVYSQRSPNNYDDGGGTLIQEEDTH